MRISDWSSDVCSSDLDRGVLFRIDEVGDLAVDRGAIEARRAVAGVAPDPEQPARRGRKGERAIAIGVLVDDRADLAALIVADADAVAVVADDILGPGEPAVVGARLVVGAAEIGLAFGARAFVAEQFGRAAFEPAAVARVGGAGGGRR